MKKILLIFTLTFFICTTVVAQGGKVDALRIAYISKRLSLTPEEAKIFWPIYELYKKDLNDLRIRYKAVLKAEPEDMTAKTDAEAEKMLAEMIAYKQAQIDLTKKYITEFGKAISKKKIVLLYKSEEDFKRELIKKLQKTGQKPVINDD